MVAEMKRNLKMMGRRNESQNVKWSSGSNNHRVESCEMIGEP